VFRSCGANLILTSSAGSELVTALNDNWACPHLQWVASAVKPNRALQCEKIQSADTGHLEFQADVWQLYLSALRWNCLLMT